MRNFSLTHFFRIQYISTFISSYNYNRYVHGNDDGIVVEVAYTRFEGDEYDVTIEDVTTLDFDLDNDADNLPEDVLEDLSENGVSIEEVESLELML